MYLLQVFLLALSITSSCVYSTETIEELSSPEKKSKKQEKSQKNEKLSDEFFNGSVLTVEIKISSKEWKYLKNEPRRYVKCTVKEISNKGTQTYEKVAVKLKGSSGSYRGPEAKPALTLDFHEYVGSKRFHGMEKIHLQNGVQDPDFLNQIVGYEMAKLANLPVPRCIPILIKWQDKPIELYLAKEAFTKDFLSRYFTDPTGELYEGNVGDIIALLEREKKSEPEKSHPEFEKFIEVVKTAALEKNWEALSNSLNVEGFLKMMAIENLTAHWDGYNAHLNNYRIYFDPKSKSANVLLHGMDSLFLDENWSLEKSPESLIGKTVLENPGWKKRYQEITVEVADLIFAKDWDAYIESARQRIIAGIQDKEDLSRNYTTTFEVSRKRITKRLEKVKEQSRYLTKK